MVQITPFLRVQQVGKRFLVDGGSRAVVALAEVNLEIGQGEFVCLVGPSGCGKSTLLNIIAGLESPSAGQVLLGGGAIVEPGPDRLVVFQEAALFPWLTVIQNVEFGLWAQGLAKEKRRELARAFLRIVHLSRFEQALPHELSGGMKQRVAIARALAMKPKVLLMDEPFAALDAQTRDRLHEDLQSIWEATGQTILFVTHNVTEAVYLADRVVIFTAHPGRIKRQVTIPHPRPRQKQDPALAEIARRILADLREEVRQTERAELGLDEDEQDGDRWERVRKSLEELGYLESEEL